MPKPESEGLPENKVIPDPTLEKRSRRIHSTEYKLSILAQAEACARGELGTLLRREKLYSGQLKKWREEFAEGGVERLSKSTPGPVPKLSAEQREIERLRKKNEQLQRELDISNGCLDLQKKALAMLDLTNNGNDQ